MTTENKASKRIDSITAESNCPLCLGKGTTTPHGSECSCIRRQLPAKRIDSITVKRAADTDADTSYYGEYSDEAGEFAIVAVGEHEGEFVDSLGCECGHAETEHSESEDYAIGSGGVKCSVAGCDCEDFEEVSIERGREYRFFNPNAENYVSEPDADIRKYCLQDYNRMRDLNRGEWYYIGIVAEARVIIGDHVQTINGGSIWGIESDGDPSEFRSIERDCLDELRGQLHAIGFSKRAIAAAMRNVQRKDE